MTVVSADDLVAFLEDDLSQSFVVSRTGGLWTLVRRSTSREVGLDFTSQELCEYVDRFADEAFEILGVEPRWKSAVALIGTYITERAAMLADTASWVVYKHGRFVSAQGPRQHGDR